MTRNVLKKIVVILFLVLIAASALTYVLANIRSVFTAQVLGVYNSTVFVKVESGSLSTDEEVFVLVSADTEIKNVDGEIIEITDFKIGDTIKVVYDGEIMESDPARIGNCFKIRVLETGEVES